MLMLVLLILMVMLMMLLMRMRMRMRMQCACCLVCTGCVASRAGHALPLLIALLRGCCCCLRALATLGAQWMGAVDVIITKAGPGTIAEALISGLPILLNGNVPCQVRAHAGHAEACTTCVAPSHCRPVSPPQLHTNTCP